jgi:hypothetical protein
MPTSCLELIYQRTDSVEMIRTVLADVQPQRLKLNLTHHPETAVNLTALGEVAIPTLESLEVNVHMIEGANILMPMVSLLVRL